MERNSLTEQQYNNLIDRISPLILGRGPCDTSMDMVAQHLSMSKRTLYEIFISKDDMIKEVLTRLRMNFRERIMKIIRESCDTMEAMAKIFLFHQEVMENINAKFFQDLDSRYKEIRKDYDHGFETWKTQLISSFSLGVKQGVFRRDANYEVIVSLLRIQMESLKRMEEFFPEDITVKEASNAICLGLLRSVASPEGMKILDALTPRFFGNRTGNDNNDINPRTQSET